MFRVYKPQDDWRCVSRHMQPLQSTSFKPRTYSISAALQDLTSDLMKPRQREQAQPENLASTQPENDSASTAV